MRKRFLAALLLGGCLFGQSIRQNPGFRANAIPANDDGSGPETTLGFTLNFFGRQRSTAWVNNNGNITFDSPLSTFTPFGLESTRREIIAAFFADVDTRAAGSTLVTYGPDAINGRPAFGANYVNVGYFNAKSDKLNRFQIVIVERSDTGEGNFDIEFNYERISWETGEASGGVNGFGGVSAAVGWSNGSGAPGTSFELDGSLLPGSFLDNSRQSLARGRLNNNVGGRWLFRARGGRLQQPLSIESRCPLPPAVVGVPYLQRMAATGASGTYRWSLVADPGSSLPAGLSISPDGTISGTPTVLGASEFELRVSSTTEDGDQIDSDRCSLVVGPPSLSISTACPLPAATVGQPYARALAVTGGRVPYRWSLAPESQPLPAGLAISANGIISGTPASPGTSVVLLQVGSNEADGATPAKRSCSITVNPAVLTLTTSCALPSATVGVPYSQELLVSGGVAPFTWSAAGGLPAGLSLSPNGRLEGVPGAVSNTMFRARVSDARGTVVEQSCALSVQESAIRIGTVCPLPTGVTGQPYTQMFSAAGGTAPYTWSALGSLPAGLNLSADGALSGNPGGAGTASFRVLVTDSEGRIGAQGCTVTMMRGDYSLASCPLPQGAVGVDYSYRLVMEGGLTPYFFTATGALPAGLTVTSAGLVTGRPREAGEFPVAIRVLDAAGRVTAQPCPIRIRPSTIEIGGTCPLPKANIGAPYLQRFTAAGGTAPYRFRLDGRLPGGLELSTDGVLRGTPLTAARESFELEVTDGANRTVTKACSIESALPVLPSMRFASLPSTIAAASAGPAVTLELGSAYSLPLEGELVLTGEADTGVNDDAVNRVDPTVRFVNGRRVLPFTLAPGARQVSTSLTTTGTVASAVTVSLGNLKIAGVPVIATVTPRQFRVPRAAPALADGCYVVSDEGLNVTISGSSTTRQIQTASFDYTIGRAPFAEQKNRTMDVSDVSYGYFSRDDSVRTGGAFSLTLFVPVDPFEISAVSVSVTNSAGTSATRTIQRCR